MIALELLSPAKDLDCGRAAIDHGADAVYIGAQRFGARAAAGNDIKDIDTLCRYAHAFNAKVYVTVNTLIREDEREDVERLIKRIEDVGVDAVLVQDMAVAKMVMNTKNIDLHSSTQMDNRTVDDIRQRARQHFKRVVLARELSVSQIAFIHNQVPDMELEVFVHGSLCVSYSGCCFASEYCFNRSANRGECAQFCRLKFSLEDADGRMIVKDKYLLSLKDMNRSSEIEALIHAGATSFKIEGRLKDITYVKNVTAAYNDILNAFITRHNDKYCRSSKGTCKYAFTPDLNRTFNRGYTTYFANGNRSEISSMDTPKAMGEYVGEVKEVHDNSFTIAGMRKIANGDGLCYINDSHILEGFRVNKAVGNHLFPVFAQNPHTRSYAGAAQRLHPHVKLYRNSDVAFERQVGRSQDCRKIGLSIRIEVIDDGFRLIAGHTNTTAVQEFEYSFTCEHQKAKNSQRENIIRQLSKLGGTIYECTKVVIPDGFDYFIPSSVLTDARRKLIEKMS